MRKQAISLAAGSAGSAPLWPNLSQDDRSLVGPTDPADFCWLVSSIT